MSVKVVPPLFITTPNDKLVVVDVYAGGPTPAEPTNLLNSVSNVAGNALTKALGMNTSGMSIFKKAVDFTLSGKSFNGKDFAKMMLGEVFPNAKSALNDLKGGLINSIAQSIGLNADTALSAYRAVKDGDYDNIMKNLANSNPLAKLYIDGHEIIKKAEDIDSLGDLFSVAGDIFGNGQIGEMLNLGEEFTAFKSLVDTAVSLRVPELADYLIDKVDGTSKDKLTRAAAIQAGKVGDSSALFSYIYRMNAAEIMNEEPMLLEDFVSQYNFPNEDGPTPEAMNMLTSILDKLQPDWDGTISGRPRLDVWMNASPAVKQLVNVDGRYSKLVVAAEQLKTLSLSDSVQRTMPWIELKTDGAINLV